MNRTDRRDVVQAVVAAFVTLQPRVILLVRALLTVDMRCDAGAMISASHNPYEDNGVKFFSSDGFKLPDQVEAQIQLLGSRSRKHPHGRSDCWSRRIAKPS